LKALMQVTPVVDPPDLFQFIARMGVKPCPLMADGVCQKNFGI